MELDLALDVATRSSCKDDSPSANAASDAAETDEPQRLRSDRHAFMKLLRDGVQRKIDKELERKSSNIRDNNADAAAIGSHDVLDDSGDNNTSRRDTDTSNRGDRAWHTLAWRDVYSTEPFFEETVNGAPLRIKQMLQGELNGLGTGLTVWPAACVLLKYLDHYFTTTTRQLEGQVVLELGSGTGAVGIAAAMLRAARVVLTDVDSVRFLMQANADLALDELQRNCNSAHDVHDATACVPCVHVASYEWGAEPSDDIVTRDANGAEQLPDLILVSDCILPRLYPIEPLVAALDRLCGPHTRVLVSYEQRYFAPFDPKQRFWSLMRARGFALRAISPTEFHPRYRAEDIEIWDIARH